MGLGNGDLRRPPLLRHVSSSCLSGFPPAHMRSNGERVEHVREIFRDGRKALRARFAVGFMGSRGSSGCSLRLHCARMLVSKREYSVVSVPVSYNVWKRQKRVRDMLLKYENKFYAIHIVSVCYPNPIV